MATTVASMKADVSLDTRGLKKGADLTRREFSSLQRTFRSLTTAEEKQERQIEDLKRAYKTGTISLKQYNEAQRRLARQTQTTTRSLKTQQAVTGGRGMGGMMMAGVGRLAAPVAGALTVGAAARGVGGLIDYAASLGDTADLLGTTTQNLQAMHQAMAVTGNTAEQFNTALQRQTRRLGQAIDGTGEAVKVLDALGLEAERFAGMDPTEAFIELGTAITSTGTRAEQLAKAMGLWDTEGVGLLRTLDMGPEKLREFRERFGTVTQEIADDARKFQESMATLRANVQAEAYQTYQQGKRAVEQGDLSGSAGFGGGLWALGAAWGSRQTQDAYYPRRSAAFERQGFVETSPGVQFAGGSGRMENPLTSLDEWTKIGQSQLDALQQIQNNTKDIPESQTMFRVDEVTVNTEP